MILKGKFVKAGEEAYALDAFTNEKLAELGLRETSRDPVNGERTYMGVRDDWRVVRTSPARSHSIVSFGSMRPEMLIGDQWVKGPAVDLETFVTQERPFRFPASVQLTKMIDGPAPKI